MVMRGMQRNPRNGGSRNFPGARRERSGVRGFTLIEICIGLAIIGILAAIAIPAYLNYIDRTRVKLCIRNIRLLENAIKIYELENMRLPISDDLADLGPVDLLNDSGNTVRQSYPFLDPYGNRFRYLNFANEPPGWPNCRTDGVDKPLSLDYDLYSMGADGLTQKKLTQSRSLDDIVRARSGAFVDLASKY